MLVMMQNDWMRLVMLMMTADEGKQHFAIPVPN
jgi:hypothetical protein